MNLSLMLHEAVYSLLIQRAKTLRIGGRAAWNLNMQEVDKNSFVVSAGAGHDISFELELIAQTGCQIVLLDPSPTGCKTVEKIQLPPEITFEPIALSDRTGQMTLAKPANLLEGSWRVAVDGEGDTMPCTSIGEIMERHSKSSVELLKIDIEGFEYQVVQDIILNKIPVKQICVEIHQGFEFGKTRWDRWRLIYQLHQSGYRLIHYDGWDHTFLHRSAIKKQ
jgi:FkbM family methyltransferase